MIRSSLQSVLFISLLAVAITAGAVDTEDEEPEARASSDSVTFSGGGLSKVSADFKNVKDAVNLDAVIGFRIPTVQWFSVELNISQTVVPGDITAACVPRNATPGTPAGPGGIPPATPGTPAVTCSGTDTSTDNRQDFQAFVFGAFASVRTPGKFYGLGKIGYRTVNSSLDEHQEERSGSSYGVGVGYRWDPRSQKGAELVYTKHGDLFDGIGFNINYGFGGRD